MQEEELDSLKESIEAVDQNRPPLKVINGYSILDHLGTGAFGSVFKVKKWARLHFVSEWPHASGGSHESVIGSNEYTRWQVRKQSGQNLLALKEVNLHNPAFGKDKKSRDSNVEKIISELTIIKEQAQSFSFNHWQSVYDLSDLVQLFFFVLFMCWFDLPLKMTHPNVVKYYKTFLEGEDNYLHRSLSPPGRNLTKKIQSWISLLISGDRLYIVMELIEGVPLAEHFSSLKEKQQQFTEDRIWNIFIQVTT